MKVKLSLLLNALLCYATPIFITEALRLTANVQLLQPTLLQLISLLYNFLWLTLTTRFVTNRDHAHLSKNLKNDTMSRAWDYGYALEADTHNAQEQLQETIQHL